MGTIVSRHDERRIERANYIGALVATVGMCGVIVAILIFAGQAVFWIQAGRWFGAPTVGSSNLYRGRGNRVCPSRHWRQNLRAGAGLGVACAEARLASSRSPTPRNHAGRHSAHWECGHVRREARVAAATRGERAHGRSGRRARFDNVRVKCLDCERSKIFPAGKLLPAPCRQHLLLFDDELCRAVAAGQNETSEAASQC